MEEIESSGIRHISHPVIGTRLKQIEIGTLKIIVSEKSPNPEDNHERQRHWISIASTRLQQT
jgi:hypothetical protein